MMGVIRNLIHFFFPQKKESAPVNVEQLRTAFRQRYHHFKLLLNANQKALEIMAEMEEALKGNRPFGMTFVRSHCIRVSASVFQIISHLCELAPEKYDSLHPRFKYIQNQINPHITHQPESTAGPLVLPLNQVDKHLTDQVGGKIANLGELKSRLHISVPDGFVVTASGFYRFMTFNDLQPEIDRRIQASSKERLDSLYSLSASIQHLIMNAPLPEDLESAISEQIRSFSAKRGKDIRFAVRSSALGEDFLTTSFAGQYRSILNVSSDHVFQAYKEIIASKYSLQAVTYRLNRGIRDEDVAMCVGCLEMVQAVSGGVLYSRNPVDIRDDSVVINSVWGLPKSVVDGSTNPDAFILSRQDTPVIRKREISLKQQKFVCYPEEGVCRMDAVGNERFESSLSDDQAVHLAQLAIQLEEFYGAPQDVEWAVGSDGSVIILQCRPLQQIEASDQLSETTMLSSTFGSPILSGGTTASPGAAAGPVFIVSKDMDVLKFPSGAVLVTAQALPRWAPLLNRTAAIVTEQGSVAGHLANVAREFNVPALFGVKGALDKLKEKKDITVDADGKRIYNGYAALELKSLKKEKSLMAKSPVFETLKDVSRLIVPLNLLDPDAPDFRPENCKSLHDITRYCHEKSVQEMFQFGSQHHFPERSSKQLVAKVPMQWWVLNLDDGFREEVEGKFVNLENIVSIPMIALWEGITAIPWEGPPGVDGKGFLSVMFQATTNTSLVTGVRSRYANRNYFMISKNYCSLNSRLGFHFSTVETLISDRDVENYISFQFKGGAADADRKNRRVIFIAEILEENDFRVDLKEDYLIARRENYEKEVMLNSLNIIGYLTIHTRQLDMIMSNRNSVNYYRTKIKNDIQKITRTLPTGGPAAPSP